jgi:hypothetical protein
VSADYAASRGLDVPDIAAPPDFNVEAWREDGAATRGEADIELARARWFDTKEIEASVDEFAEWHAWHDDAFDHGGPMPEDLAMPDARANDADMDMGD